MMMMTTIQSRVGKSHREGEGVVETFCVLLPKSWLSPYHCLGSMAGCAERTEGGSWLVLVVCLLWFSLRLVNSEMTLSCTGGE